MIRDESFPATLQNTFFLKRFSSHCLPPRSWAFWHEVATFFTQCMAPCYPRFFLLKYNYLTATWVFLNIFSPALHCWATKRSSTTPSLIHPDFPFSLPVFLTFFLTKDCRYECAKFWEDFGGVRGWHSRFMCCTRARVFYEQREFQTHTWSLKIAIFLFQDPTFNFFFFEFFWPFNWRILRLCTVRKFLS